MNTSFGASNNFGHADYYGNLNSGMSNQDILDYINSNSGNLHEDRFAPGELVSQIQQAAANDAMLAKDQAAKQEQLRQQQAAMNQLQQSFDGRMAAVNAQMLQQQQSYSTTLAEQTANFNATQQQQQAQYTTDLTSMQDRFSQRYAEQNQLYTGNLNAVREELTTRQQQQAAKYAADYLQQQEKFATNTQQQQDRYASNILNMQNTYNTNRTSQEQRYNDNIQSMQNTFREQQNQLKDTLNAKANPHSRQTQVGVQAPNANDKAKAAQLQARGTKGSFNRQGLRIQGLNI